MEPTPDPPNDYRRPGPEAAGNARHLLTLAWYATDEILDEQTHLLHRAWTDLTTHQQWLALNVIIGHYIGLIRDHNEQLTGSPPDEYFTHMMALQARYWDRYDEDDLRED